MKLMKTPRSLDIKITNRCNLRCLYCSHFSSASDVNSDLPKEEWLAFFEELNRCNVMNITLEGGEPFFRPDIKEIIAGIVRNRMRYSVLTNGTLIDDELASFIASTRRCNTIQVSIDGASPESHDICRGKGNFQKAIDGIRCLQKYNVPLTVRVTIHKGNVNDLDNIARLLLEDLKLHDFSTNCASYMGLCRQNSEIVQLDVKDQVSAMKSLLELNKKYPGRINGSAGPLANAKQWMQMESARLEKKESFPGGGYLTSCNGPMEKIAVRPDGIFVPCLQISHIELGRINKDALIDVWQKHPELLKLRERHNIPLTKFEFCSGCDYIPYCSGNCPALAYTMVGDIYHPSPDACLRKFLSDGGTLPNSMLLDELVEKSGVLLP